TSSGLPVTITQTISGGFITLTGTTTAGTIFTFQVNQATGAYTYTQSGPLDHPDHGVNGSETGSADPIVLTFDYIVTDRDGDNATGAINVTIDDDGPVARGSGTISVTEDGTAAGAFIEQSAGGTLLFDAGADGAQVTDITYRFGSKALDMDAPGGFPALTSGGQQVVVTASADGLTVTGMAGSTVVFTLHVTDPVTGAYTFTQKAPIDHPDINESGAADALRLVFDFTVTDGDGDTSTSWVQVDIRDDAPTVIGDGNTNVALYESHIHAIPGVQSAGTEATLASDVTGTISKVDFGADGFGSLKFSGSFNVPNGGHAALVGGGAGADSGLTSDGEAVYFRLSSDGKTVEGYVPGRGDEIILTATLNGVDTGYTVNLLGNIDHQLPDGVPGGRDEAQSINFTVTATDGDGDTANVTLSLRINDDAPTAAALVRVGLDDDALPGGNPGGIGDAADSSNATGTLAVHFGADGGTIGWLAPEFESSHQGYSYEIDGQTLKIFQLQDSHTVQVLSVTLNATTGAYDVEQLAAIRHPTGAEENEVPFNLNYRVTDGDGDTADGVIRVVVDDDTPVINGNTTQVNLLTNGDFSGGTFAHQESW
ncbi:DUF5801 repeats-in-toxin domain-containing protein, partial [Mesorhizobium sp.]|uniref:T1SS-143 repeat domain-containing protein n=1 Tax=Mesorhizobium sp. TaxID=1871066 RepID=UPI0025EE01FB